MEGWRLKRWRMDDGRLELGGVSGADGLCLNITDTTKIKEEEPLSVFGAAAVASCLLGSTCSRSPRHFTCRDQCCVVSLLAPALPFLPPPLCTSAAVHIQDAVHVLFAVALFPDHHRHIRISTSDGAGVHPLCYVYTHS